jgi:hypothetical protein
VDEDPSVIGRAVGEPELPALDNVTEAIPLTASSSKSRFVLVVVPHVPDCSPVAIFSIPRLVV